MKQSRRYLKYNGICRFARARRLRMQHTVAVSTYTAIGIECLTLKYHIHKSHNSRKLAQQHV